MSPNDSGKISPEGKRAAERVRAIFFLIAAANIVIVAIVIWQRQISNDGPSAQMETCFATALAAYNAKDRPGFLACFSAKAEPRADEAFFSTKIEGEYHRDFGRVTAHQLNPAATTTDTAGGTLGYDIACEKQPRARLTAKFVREKDTAKLLAWRIEP